MVTDATQPKPSSAALFSARGWFVLIILCAAQFLVGLDFSIVSVALPSIGRALGFATTGDLQWVMTAYILFIAGFLLLFGRASDLFGRRRLLAIGLLLFTIFSLAGGLATAPGILIAARAGQGIGAAMVGPSALSLVTTSFREGAEREKALSVNGTVLMLGFIVGVIGGGVITDLLSWRWTMLLLSITGGIVLIGVLAMISENRVNTAVRLDAPGAVLATGGMLAVIYGISTGDRAGWTSVPTLAALCGGVALLGAFLFAESRHPAPLAPLDVLRRPTVKWGSLAGFTTFGMCGGTTVLLTLYMQDVLNYSPMITGLALIPLGGSAVIGGLVGARVIGRLGVTPSLITGLLVQTVSTASMVLLPVEGNFPVLTMTSIGLGFGHVTAVIAFNLTVTSGLPNDKQGLVSGIAQTAQQLGSATGLPVLAAVVTARTQALSSSSNGDQANVAGLHAGMLTAAVVVFAVSLITVAFLRRATQEAESEDVAATTAAST